MKMGTRDGHETCNLAQEKYSKVVNGKNQNDKENILEGTTSFARNY